MDARMSDTPRAGRRSRVPTIRSRRVGSSLIELVITLGLISVFMAIGVSTVRLLMLTERSNADDLQARRELLRLHRDLRRDARDYQLSVVEVQDANGTWQMECRRPDGELVVVYAVDPHRVERREVGLGRPEIRELFRFNPPAAVRIRPGPEELEWTVSPGWRHASSSRHDDSSSGLVWKLPVSILSNLKSDRS